MTAAPFSRFLRRVERHRRLAKFPPPRQLSFTLFTLFILSTCVWRLRHGRLDARTTQQVRLLDADAALAASTAGDELVRAAVSRVAVTPTGGGKRVVLVTAVNYAFRHYLVNFNCSLRAAGAEQPYAPLVISMDAEMHMYAQHAGFESLHLPLAGEAAELGGEGKVDERAHLFGSKAFNLLSKQKLYAVYKVLQTGADVLFSDADIVWCADAVEEVTTEMYGRDWGRDPITPRMPHLLMQTAWPRSLLNSGFYYARASRELVQAFEAFLAHDADSENDQVIVNRVMCKSQFNGAVIMNGTYAHPEAPRRLMPALCRWDGRVDARLLEAGRFPTGGEIIEGKKIFHHPRRFVAALCSKRDVCILHNNCILSSKKKARFIVKGMWHVADNGETCLQQPAPSTFATRRQCGGAKCGPEGDTYRYPELVV